MRLPLVMLCLAALGSACNSERTEAPVAWEGVAQAPAPTPERFVVEKHPEHPIGFRLRLLDMVQREYREPDRFAPIRVAVVFDEERPMPHYLGELHDSVRVNSSLCCGGGLVRIPAKERQFDFSATHFYLYVGNRPELVDNWRIGPFVVERPSGMASDLWVEGDTFGTLDLLLVSEDNIAKLRYEGPRHSPMTEDDIHRNHALALKEKALLGPARQRRFGKLYDCAPGEPAEGALSLTIPAREELTGQATLRFSRPLLVNGQRTKELTVPAQRGAVQRWRLGHHEAYLDIADGDVLAVESRDGALWISGEHFESSPHIQSRGAFPSRAEVLVPVEDGDSIRALGNDTGTHEFELSQPHAIAKTDGRHIVGIGECKSELFMRAGSRWVVQWNESDEVEFEIHTPLPRSVDIDVPGR